MPFFEFEAITGNYFLMYFFTSFMHVGGRTVLSLLACITADGEVIQINKMQIKRSAFTCANAHNREREREGGGGGGGGANLFRRGISYSGIIYLGDKLFPNKLSGG